jgi:hypothetical protein
MWIAVGVSSSILSDFHFRCFALVHSRRLEAAKALKKMFKNFPPKQK